MLFSDEATNGTFNTMSNYYPFSACLDFIVWQCWDMTGLVEFGSGMCLSYVPCYEGSVSIWHLLKQDISPLGPVLDLEGAASGHSISISHFWSLNR